MGSLSIAGGALAGECDRRPAEVDAYLRVHPGWKMVTLADLDADSRTLWNESHKGLCPGMAVVDLDGGQGRSFALALMGLSKGQRVEMLVLLRRTGRAPRKLIAEVVEPASRMYGPIVVSRSAPGVAREWDSGHRTRISHDAFVYEAMESAATVYYYDKGHRRRVQVSD